MLDINQQGTELEIFLKAKRWKEYWSSQIVKYLKGTVLEVGAGIGANAILLSGLASQWVCLEPSAPLAQKLEENLSHDRYSHCRIVRGYLRDLGSDQQYDAIIYIDVLEHIDNDVAEMAGASGRLKPGGRLIVLVPAHQWLYSPFDREIGHYRRYNRQDLLRRAPENLIEERVVYLDSIGLIASAGNKLLLQKTMPTAGQILFWDRAMIPLSRWLDPILRYKLGKSLLAVWQKGGG